MRYKGVLFDLYGTLVPPFKQEVSRTNLVSMARVLGVSVPSFLALWQETFQERETGVFDGLQANIRYVLHKMNQLADQTTVAQAETIRKAFSRDSLVPRPEALPILDWLRSRRIPTALVSNASVQIPGVWLETELSKHFHVAIFSSEIGKAKPASDMYIRACDGLGLNPKQCLYIGDVSDMELGGATRVGLDAVLIRHPGDDLDDPFRPEAKHWSGRQISSLMDVMNLMGS